MAATVTVNGIEVETATLASFALFCPKRAHGNPEYGKLAVLRIDDGQGGSTITKRAEAVVLKVLLGSLGLPDVSRDWMPVLDPFLSPASAGCAGPDTATTGRHSHNPR